VALALERRERFSYPERILRPDGTIRQLETIGEVNLATDGRLLGLLGTCRDVTDDRNRDAAIRLARRHEIEDARILERIVSDAPLAEVLDAIARSIEARVEGTLASILLLDGIHVRHGAAPSLPDEFVHAIDGLAIGPSAGSCGTAAFRKETVIVSDIATDPLWAEYRAAALPHGLRACWSTPIMSKQGLVLGTFALYRKEPHVPDEDERRTVARVVHLAGIAIERRQLEDQLRALSARVEEVREEERTGIAREVHDELGQSLTALKMDLAWLARRIPRVDAVTEKLTAMSDMIDETIQVVRRISAELRPGVLDDLGLLAAIEWQANERQKRNAVRCTVSSNLGDAKLERAVSTAVFRIVQEAMTNIERHAGATHVAVTLDRIGDELRFEVVDNGRGITREEASRPTSLGLLGIRERARRLGGVAIIGPASPKGTRVELRLPLKEAS
jgi:signal transduction histidine kinase